MGEIEKGIPIPRVRSEHNWEDMEHGDSQVVPRGASSSARKFVKDQRPGWKVTERSLPDDEENIRLWFTNPVEAARIASAGEEGGEEENEVVEPAAKPTGPQLGRPPRGGRK